MTVRKLVKKLKQDQVKTERELGSLNEEWHECTWEGDRAEIESWIGYYEEKYRIIKEILEYIEEGR